MVALGGSSSPYTSLAQDDEDEHMEPRPSIYYGDGPFSPPSSIDEGQEKVFQRDAFLKEEDDDESMDNGTIEAGRPALPLDNPPSRPSALKALIVALVGLVCTSALIGIFAARSYNGATFRTRSRQQLTLDHVFNGTFSAQSKSLNWVAEAGDGVYSVQEGSSIVLVNITTGTNKTLVSQRDTRDEHGKPIVWTQWKLSADMKYILLKTDHLKQWRHSSFGNYYVHNIAERVTTPIAPPTSPSKISYVAWSPTGRSISYVSENDIYIIPDAANVESPIRVTSSGNSSLFHGVPDWVYEEEVFSSDYTLWWSPDGSRIAFLRLDETTVENYDFPVYNPSRWDSSEVHPYPDWVSMRYPKPGYDNPTVSIHIFSLDQYQAAATAKSSLKFNVTTAVTSSSLALTWDGQLPVKNSIITEVAWVSNSTLIVKEVSRAADKGNVVIFDLERAALSGKGRVVRKLGEKGEEGDDGWIESDQRIYPLTHPVSAASVGESGYLDIVPTADGFNHIALFSPADSSVPRWLTSGDWEVTGSILKVDHVRGLIYFIASSKSGTERHLHTVPLPTISGLPQPSVTPLVKLTNLTDVSQAGYYRASFSPEAGYYVLSYQGPDVPWQKVVSVANSTLDYILTDNTALNQTLTEFQSPLVTYSTIDSDGYELNVKEMRPPGMDDTGRVKYPVLFRVYGGPGSQLVDNRFSRDWHDYLTCTLKYVVVIVDGRGTGFKGRKLRNPVRGNLGFFETVDQINAARQWAAKRYVDTKRIGIWGWSYGGFMTSKVMEADAGIHTLGMAVAPVVSWRMYDSVYTERYMRTPLENPNGYLNASITNVTGFGHADFLLAHGSGDDNVHFANSAHLLDMFTTAQIRDYEFRMFTDSDHSISTRGANRELYEWMTAFLVDKWGKGGTRRV